MGVLWEELAEETGLMKLVLPEELLSRLRLEVSDAGLTTVGVATDVDMSKL